MKRISVFLLFVFSMFGLVSTAIAGGVPGLPTVSVTPTPQPTQVVQIYSGWNMLGNGNYNTITVAETFGSFDQKGVNIPGLTEKIGSVWKLSMVTGRWEFYSPHFSFEGLASYAASMGFDVLTTINTGEGYWLLSNADFVLPTPGQPADDMIISWQSGGVRDGLSMIAVPMPMTVEEIAGLFSNTPPSFGAVPGSSNVESIWQYDPVDGKWAVYMPQMLQQQGSAYTDNVIYSAGNKKFFGYLKEGSSFYIFYQRNPNNGKG